MPSKTKGLEQIRLTLKTYSNSTILTSLLYHTIDPPKNKSIILLLPLNSLFQNDKISSGAMMKDETAQNGSMTVHDIYKS